MQKQVALYGAGEVGQSYFYQIKKWGGCTLSLWVDKRYEVYQYLDERIDPVTKLSVTIWDYVIVAVASESIANEIKSELISCGIDGNVILWENPILLQK